jgi:hypothetical protein
MDTIRPAGEFLVAGLTLVGGVVAMAVVALVLL